MILSPPKNDNAREIGFFVLGLTFSVFGNIVANGLWEIAGEKSLSFNQWVEFFMSFIVFAVLIYMCYPHLIKE